MKPFKHAAIAVAVFFLVAGVAAAAPSIDKVARLFFGSIQVLRAGTAPSTAHRLTQVGGYQVSVNFGGTDGGAYSCDYVTATATGAKIGDPCFASPPIDVDGGVIELNRTDSTFTCRVQANDQVQLGLCGPGATGNPDAGTTTVRVFSSQL